MQRKPDDFAIGAFFDELATQPWLGYRRRIWPHFFFHITNVENAASILKSGRLLSRSRALAAQCMVTDNASPEVLRQSDPSRFDHVRLYFRPRTPTFFRNEGIRPIGFRSLGAHCPVPAALLFDAKTVAGRADARFSDGNLASRLAVLGDDVAFLRALDFREIYHEGPTNLKNTNRLTTRRQAEIVGPGELALNDLRFVVTRSEAERVTLLTLLSDYAWTQPPLLETIFVDSNLFHCDWTYIERVTLVGDRARFLFNPDSQTPGPFTARFVWTNPVTGASATASDSLRGLGTQTVNVPAKCQGPAVHLIMHLERRAEVVTLWHDGAWHDAPRPTSVNAWLPPWTRACRRVKRRPAFASASARCTAGWPSIGRASRWPTSPAPGGHPS